MSTPTTVERDSNRIIEAELDLRARALAGIARADVLGYIGPIYPPADDEIKESLESLPDKRRAILVLLETHGGLITTAERIAHILRKHYRRVDFAVPTFAMSAGTVLVMAGDNILMDYASMLGPIDPQVVKRDRLVPAVGYLEQYERFVRRSRQGALTTAELTYFVQNFDAAELYAYEQERELSVVMLVEWLVKYKFKNWKVTETRGITVTNKMRKERAREIARALGDASRWHSHSRGIPMEVLRRDLKLLIDDFGARHDLADAIHNYFRLLQDYKMRRAHDEFVVHCEGRHVGY